MVQIFIEKHGAQPIVLFSAISLVVLAIACIFSVNFMGVPSQARAAQIRGNMRAIQLAADDYAGHHHGHYPKSLHALQPYLAGGSHVSDGRPGLLPMNPESPEHVACVDGFESLGTGQTLYPGQVVYFGRDDKYVITAIGQAVSLSSGVVSYTSTKTGPTLAKLSRGMWFQNLIR